MEALVILAIIVGFGVFVYVVYKEGNKTGRIEMSDKAFRKRDKIEEAAKKKWDELDIKLRSRRAVNREWMRRNLFKHEV